MDFPEESVSKGFNDLEKQLARTKDDFILALDALSQFLTEKSSKEMFDLLSYNKIFFEKMLNINTIVGNIIKFFKNIEEDNSLLYQHPEIGDYFDNIMQIFQKSVKNLYSQKTPFLNNLNLDVNTYEGLFVSLKNNIQPMSQKEKIFDEIICDYDKIKAILEKFICEDDGTGNAVVDSEGFDLSGIDILAEMPDTKQ